MKIIQFLLVTVVMNIWALLKRRGQPAQAPASAGSVKGLAKSFSRGLVRRLGFGLCLCMASLSIGAGVAHAQFVFGTNTVPMGLFKQPVGWAAGQGTCDGSNLIAFGGFQATDPDSHWSRPSTHTVGQPLPALPNGHTTFITCQSSIPRMNETITTTISGLTNGGTYQLQFYGSTASITAPISTICAPPNMLLVVIDGNETTHTTPCGTWGTITVPFTATGTTATLEVGGGVDPSLAQNWINFSIGSGAVTAVAPPNSSPVAVDDTDAGSTSSTVSVNVLANDTDADAGDTLSVTAVAAGCTTSTTLPTTGNVVFNTQATAGMQTCTYTVSDGTDTDTADVVITVAPANVAPVISSANTAAFAENGTGTVLDVNSTDDNDNEGSGLVYSLTGSGADDALFSINSGTGVITFTATPDFEAPTDAGTNNVYNAEVQVCDSGSLCTTQAIAITVTDVAENTAPVASDPSDTATVGGGTGSFTLAQLGADSDGTIASVSAVTCSGSDGSATATAAGVSYTMPAASTTTTCDYTITDDDGDTDTGTFTLTAPAPLDSDGDGLLDTQEDTNGNGVYDAGTDYSNLNNPDTDGDGLDDGAEDANRNGRRDFVTIGEGILLIETDPLNPDSDGDGLADGVEDANQNGRRDSGETNPLRWDTDWDTLSDGDEAAIDTDGDGLINPLDNDDDGDTILTRYEDTDGDGDLSNDDTDGNGTPDYLDNDDDGDNLLTADENPDINGDGNPADAQDTDNDGTPDYLDSQATPPAAIILNARVWLQGAAHPTGMIDKLRVAGVLPTQEPYSQTILNPFTGHQGNETLSAALLATEGMSAPVDWVLVELRDVSDPTQVLATQAAVVLRNSRVVDAATGSEDLQFNLPTGDYQVAVRHRNHLGAMTLTAVSLSNTPALVNFGSPDLVTWGVHARMISGDKALLRTGDANHDGRIVTDGPFNDLTYLLARVLSAPENTAFNVNYIASGYQTADLSLDGQSIFSGMGNDNNLALGNILLHPENSVMNGNYIITEQIPQEP